MYLYVHISYCVSCYVYIYNNIHIVKTCVAIYIYTRTLLTFHNFDTKTQQTKTGPRHVDTPRPALYMASSLQAGGRHISSSHILRGTLLSW